MKKRIKKFYTDHKVGCLQTALLVTNAVAIVAIYKIADGGQITHMVTRQNEDTGERRFVVIKKNGQERWFPYEPDVVY